MTIAFFSNFFNHHQAPIADELYKLTDGNYWFVETEDLPDSFKKRGYPVYQKPYYLKAWESPDNHEKAVELALNADVAIFLTSTILLYGKQRLLAKKLTFEYSERWLKKGLLNILSPNLIKHQWFYYRYGKRAPLYMLCCSAYAPNDYYLLNSFVDKCYKWAYFTQVHSIDVKNILKSKIKQKLSFMWCARFINWKHPEIPILLAHRMKQDGLDFVINMYGDGPLLDRIEKMILNYELQDYVYLKGNAPNSKIVESMRAHDVFLFTSDRNEGWGAVANEAMSNGCVLVASDQIGAVPYLVKDEVNGLIYKSCDVNSLYMAIRKLIKNRDLLERLACNAYHDMQSIWSPHNGALKLLNLIDSLMDGKIYIEEFGPCSKALPCKKS